MRISINTTSTSRKVIKNIVTLCVASTLTMTLTACQMVEANEKPTANKCGTFDPNDIRMCTAHFDPVCVKEKDANGNVSYRTAGNSCSACSTAQAISYTSGECQLL